jgi:hypothetical protein
LSENQRVVIADGLQAGWTIRAIAGELRRSPSTVSREVRRNRDPASGVYRPWTAQRSAVARRARPRPGKLAAAGDLHAFVADHLELADVELPPHAAGWSDRPWCPPLSPKRRRASASRTADPAARDLPSVYGWRLRPIKTALG